MGRIIKWSGFSAAVIILISLGAYNVAQAESSRSTNYQATDVEFDSLAGNESCSGQYCARTIGSGLRAPSQSSSTNFKNLTDQQPQLDIAIAHGSTDLGELSVDNASLKTVQITVRGYQSNGYLLYISGKPPRIGTHTIKAMKHQAKSEPGSEQFGINLATNRHPKLGGSVKSGLDDGAPKIAENYAKADNFRYKDGDLIASSRRNSSKDTYTISMIINVSSATPSGKYDGGFGVMAVPGF